MNTQLTPGKHEKKSEQQRKNNPRRGTSKRAIHSKSNGRYTWQNSRGHKSILDIAIAPLRYDCKILEAASNYYDHDAIVGTTNRQVIPRTAIKALTEDQQEPARTKR